MSIKKHVIDVPDVEKIGIYAIYNKVTNKYYIGSSINIKRRCLEHRRNMEGRLYFNGKMCDDLSCKRDIKNFCFLVLETFDDNTITDKELRNKEYFYIKKYNAFENGYNFESCIPYPNGKHDLDEKLSSKKKDTHTKGYNFSNLSNKKLLNKLIELISMNGSYEKIKLCKGEILNRMDK